MKKDKPKCDRCFHSGFWRVTEPDGRPGFICDKCGNHWSCGKDGGLYLGKEMGYLCP